jgi:CubicO group peptidase (beta-lactamase class C family)
MFLRIVTAVLLAVWLTAAPGTVGAQAPVGFDDALRILDTWVATTSAQRGQPGLSIGVILGDRLVWAKGYGYADLEKKVSAGPQTLYRIASITKTFTAVAILQLRDAGKLQLDDPLRRHLSWARIRAHDPAASDVTIRELLTHSSGLQREVPGTWWTTPTFPSAAALRDEMDETNAPGVVWKYSNLGFALLGEVVSAVSGEPWDRYIQRHVLDPLGMSSTRTMPRPDEPGLAQGYARPVPGERPVNVPPIGSLEAVSAAGNMASNVEDLAKYVIFHVSEGAAGSDGVVKRATLHDMHRPQWLLDDWLNAWGFGMRVRRVDGRVQVGHSGSVPGFRTQIELIPASGLGVIVLTNADDGNPASYVDYALQLLGPLAAKALARPAAPLSADAARYVGRYRSQNGTTTLLVGVLDGQLSLIAPDAANPYTMRILLEPTSEPRAFVMRSTGTFAFDAFGELLTFDVGADGQVTGYHTPNLRYTRIQQSP